MSHYGKPSYWDERYTKDPEAFDWYQRWANLSDKVVNRVEKTGHILMLGCGNSRITEEMYQDGYTSIVNIDISKVVIDQMAAKHKDKSSVTWQVMNITQLDFAENTFDFIFDKGTLDSLLCGENSTTSCQKALREIHRVLKPGGSLFCVSYGKPDNRLAYFDNRAEFAWKIEVESVPKPTIAGEVLEAGKDGNNLHYIYVCKKESE